MSKVIIMGGLALAIVLSSSPTANAQSTITACVGNDGTPRIVPSSTTSCKKNETLLSFLSGAPQARFVDNGDGTVTDNQTGLMWEKKTLDENACPRFDNVLIPRSPHCVQDTWQWTSSGTAPDGGVFAVFLARLNTAISRSGDGVNIRDVCFAGHCDWRIPNIVELQTIELSPCSNAICIDPIFGPVTGPSGSGGGGGGGAGKPATPYWSSTTFDDGNFGFTSVWAFDPLSRVKGEVPKSTFLFVRVVRSAR